jgi:Icc-related predicted phosphoesterase
LLPLHYVLERASPIPRIKAVKTNDAVADRASTKATAAKKEAVRIAAVGDLHCTKDSAGTIQPLLADVTQAADILVLCGDLTDHGLPEQAQVLARELTAAGKVPIVAVLGNHDYESGRQDEIRRLLQDAGVQVLDGEACEIRGVGFAGVKGFGGGFGRRTLAPWGEPAVKQFVQEALDETLKLESALARLRTASRIAVLHYAPTQATVEGEPLEIYPFLGCSRLEEPLNRYAVTAAFHGHAHRGCAEGRTSGGVAVYNVSLPMFRRAGPGHPLYRIIQVSATDGQGRADEPRADR